ncbi:MAG TPA: hypothetical protein VGE02_03465 [Gemmatimonadales bacterium]
MRIPQFVAMSAVAVALATTAPAAEAQFAYQPGTHRYRLEQVTEATQEMGGQSMSSTMTTTQVIGVQLERAGDSLAVTFTVDSVGIESEIPQAQAMAQAEADKLVGAKVKGSVSPRGAIGALSRVGGDSSSAGDLSAGFRNFFPRFPQGELKAGMTWTDTTTSKFDANGIDGTAISVVTYTVTGDTTVSGKQAWRIAQKGTVTTNGTGNSQGQDLALAGSGTIEGANVVSKDGLYLGGESRLDQNMTVQVVAMGIEVPVTQKVTSKVRMVE